MAPKGSEKPRLTPVAGGSVVHAAQPTAAAKRHRRPRRVRGVPDHHPKAGYRLIGGPVVFVYGGGSFGWIRVDHQIAHRPRGRHIDGTLEVSAGGVTAGASHGLQRRRQRGCYQADLDNTKPERADLFKPGTPVTVKVILGNDQTIEATAQVRRQPSGSASTRRELGCG